MRQKSKLVHFLQHLQNRFVGARSTRTSFGFRNVFSKKVQQENVDSSTSVPQKVFLQIQRENVDQSTTSTIQTFEKHFFVDFFNVENVEFVGIFCKYGFTQKDP